MTGALQGLRIGFLHDARPRGGESSLFEHLSPLLEERGGMVEMVNVEDGAYRIDERPPWDLVVLKSESAAALHLAAAARRAAGGAARRAAT